MKRKLFLLSSIALLGITLGTTACGSTGTTQASSSASQTETTETGGGSSETAGSSESSESSETTGSSESSESSETTGSSETSSEGTGESTDTGNEGEQGGADTDGHITSAEIAESLEAMAWTGTDDNVMDSFVFMQIEGQYHTGKINFNFNLSGVTIRGTITISYINEEWTISIENNPDNVLSIKEMTFPWEMGAQVFNTIEMTIGENTYVTITGSTESGGGEQGGGETTGQPTNALELIELLTSSSWMNVDTTSEDSFVFMQLDEQAGTPDVNFNFNISGTMIRGTLSVYYYEGEFGADPTNLAENTINVNTITFPWENGVQNVNKIEIGLEGNTFVTITNGLGGETGGEGDGTQETPSALTAINKLINGSWTTKGVMDSNIYAFFQLDEQAGTPDVNFTFTIADAMYRGTASVFYYEGEYGMDVTNNPANPTLIDSMSFVWANGIQLLEEVEIVIGGQATVITTASAETGTSGPTTIAEFTTLLCDNLWQKDGVQNWDYIYTFQPTEVEGKLKYQFVHNGVVANGIVEITLGDEVTLSFTDNETTETDTLYILSGGFAWTEDYSAQIFDKIELTVKIDDGVPFDILLVRNTEA